MWINKKKIIKFIKIILRFFIEFILAPSYEYLIFVLLKPIWYILDILEERWRLKWRNYLHIIVGRLQDWFRVLEHIYSTFIDDMREKYPHIVKPNRGGNKLQRCIARMQDCFSNLEHICSTAYDDFVMYKDQFIRWIYRDDD